MAGGSARDRSRRGAAAAGKPAEIHVYDQVSAGFGMSPRNLPVDSWPERFFEWMVARKIVSR